MNLPDLDKQIAIYPSGGVNEQTIDPGVNRHEAIIGLNLNPRGKTGAVMKRHLENLVSVEHIPGPFLSLYMFRFGDITPTSLTSNIFQIVGEYDYNGVFIGMELYELIYRPEFLDYIWTLRQIPPEENWGYDLELPHTIVDDSAVYQHTFEDDEIEVKERYFYLINNGKIPLEEDERSRVLIYRERPYNVTSLSAGAFRLPNMPIDSIELLEVTGGTLFTGYYYFHFLQEDSAGNVGTMFEEVEKHWMYEGQGYIHTEGMNSQIRIRVEVPEEAMPGLKHIHVFRSQRTDDSPTVINARNDEPDFFWIDTIDVIGTTNEFTIHDSRNVVTGDSRVAYFNAGLPPEDLLPPKKVYCGIVHQRRMYIAHKNSIYKSLTNHFRNYHPDDVATLTKTGDICAMNSGYNQLNIFAKNSIWIWRGRSPAEMDVVKPRKIWDNGIPLVDMYDYKWHDTVRTSGNRTLFVDKDGWPRQIVDEKVHHLSSDGNKKVYIEPTDRINATVVGNTYRITNGEKCWVCFLDKGNVWFEWDMEVLRYLFQPYDGSINKGKHIHWDYDSLFLKEHLHTYGQGDKFNDNGDGRRAIWKTASISVPGSEWVSIGFKIYKPNEEFKNIKDWGVRGNGVLSPDSPLPDKGPPPPPPPPPPTPEQVMGIEIYLDGELDPKFIRQFEVTLNEFNPGEPERYGEPQDIHFKLTSRCERLAVKVYHEKGAEFELNRIGVTPRGVQ